jgi:hypothetical protein
MDHEDRDAFALFGRAICTMSLLPARTTGPNQEGVMRKVNLAVLAVCGTIVLGAGAASAAEASADTCMSMAQQVKAALASNQQSSNYELAVKEQGFGRDFCYHGIYKTGMNHYSHALSLLGATPS